MTLNYQTVVDGTYLFSNSLSLEEKNYFLSLYKEYKHLLYTPILSSGKAMSLQMTCFGKHWNPKTYQYCECRDDYDQQPVTVYPFKLNEILNKFLLPFENQYKPEWDIGIMNCYDTGNKFKPKLGLHVDNSESLETMQSGHPIISISLGASCLFRIGGFSRRDSEYQDIALHSGDVLIFGGPSRMRYHSVLGIENGKQIAEGISTNIRVNFTFRKF